MTSQSVKQGFKIIGIKPLTGCHKDYLKILHAEELYLFYNNYSIGKDDTIIFTETVPSDFYRINNIDVNICAVVGKNGSGKSTLIEILYRAINNLAESQDLITAELENIPNLKADIFFHTDSYYKVRVSNSKVEIFGYDSDGKILKQKLENFELKQFFYTIAVNYSHYAHNTKDLEGEVNWLDGLFHKNDGYQTPLVINPMRTEGIIDINNENHLVKSRLIGNLLRPVRKENFSFRKLTDKLEAVSLKLKLNESKREKVIYENKYDNKKQIEEVTISSLAFDTEDLLKKLDNRFRFNYLSLEKEKFKLALDYIIYKLVSIATKYDDYLDFFNKHEKKFIEKRVDEFINQLYDDESHITFKLRQTINFLKHQYLELKDQKVDLTTLSKRISELNTKRKRTKIIEFVPPPIFNIDILLKTEDGLEKNVEFRKLSSGEKQMIYSVSSLLYHLINLNSIRNTKRRTGYRFINIVLEEIELYFHPEMQRTYINYILESIKRLELRSIRSINFCFVTHSPFILSDIPHSNILFLDDNGSPIKTSEQVKTFGGNIHELLAHSFFLNNGFIGEFAKERINEIFSFLNRKKCEVEIRELDNYIKNLKPNEKVLKIKLQRDRNNLQSEIEEIGLDKSFKDAVYYRQVIALIGEPFLKEKLLEKYYDVFDKSDRVAELEKELAQLKSNDKTSRK